MKQSCCLKLFVVAHVLAVFLLCPHDATGRKHKLHLVDDSRRLIHITSFGFFKGGFMDVNVHEIYLHPPLTGKEKKQIVGFTVDRTLKDGINPYPHDIESTCALNPRQSQDESSSSILFSLDFQAKYVTVDCSPTLGNVHVYRSAANIPMSIQSMSSKLPVSDIRNIMTQPQRRKRNGTAELKGFPANDSSTYYDSAEYNLSEGDGTDDLQQLKSDPIKTGGGVDRATDTDQNKVADVKALSESPGNAKPLEVLKGSDTASSDNQPAIEPQKEIFKKDGEISSNDLARKQAMDDADIPKIPAESSEETSNDKDNMIDKTPFSDPALICSGIKLPLNETKVSTATGDDFRYSFSFAVYIAGEDCEGLYNLYFHNCAEDYGSLVTLNISLVEENLRKNYLSAGEMPLPALYFMMSMLFFMAGCFWMFILKKSKRETGVAVFKIHYLMGALVFVKSLSLFFHSINYHFIQIEGAHVEGWAVLFYIAHLLKGALLFITILLIGTGYAFVKHLLSDKDKKIFMIVIPLQVLANVAQIIIEESEEAEVVHTTWQVIFISVDLLCCCAILFPVVWSIRHLQEASQTDGKAASNLRKLKLFRHFYIIVVCYIYFTRIIVQMLLKITVPFQYEWLDDMFREMTTFIFFVLTGYKFRPAVNNPYLELAHDSDDEDMDVPMTDSGLTEGAVKRGYKPKKKTLKEIVLFDPNEEDTDDDEEVLLEKRREASHDLD